MTPHEHDPNMTAPWARALSFPAVLRDGRRVRIRPVTPTDKSRIRGALDAMSPRTRYLRFHALRNGSSEPELRHLTELDYQNHVAWGARLRFSGYPAWLLWLFVHLMDLVDFENRLLVFVQWAWNYVTWNRGARLIAHGWRGED
jgi:NADH dehydrogenase